MTDREVLFRAILANPADTVARLAYADALEEGGGEERAEFVRIQCELAERHPCLFSLKGIDTCFDRRSDPDGVLKSGCDDCKGRVDRVRTLKDREKELLKEHQVAWAGSVANLMLDEDGGDADVPTIPWIWSRGFVSWVTLPLTRFLGRPCPDGCRPKSIKRRRKKGRKGVCESCHGTGYVGGMATDFFREHPIEAVRATGVLVYGPIPDGPGEGLYYLRLDGLPPVLRGRLEPLKLYQSAAVARAVAGRELVDIGREWAGITTERPAASGRP
jgi:uncharacterized protein (TIGR02996 family)